MFSVAGAGTRRAATANIHFDPAVHHVLRIADLYCSISGIVNRAMLQALRDAAAGLAAFDGP